MIRDTKRIMSDGDDVTCGSLTLIVGPMFSGKSTELMSLVEKRTVIGKECLVFAHADDDRYTDETSPDRATVSSHPSPLRASHHISAIEISNAMDAKTHVEQHGVRVDVCAFDEGQFFEDLPRVREYLCEVKGIDMIVAGLSGDFQRRMFRPIGDLIPFADDLVHKKACCKRCRRSDVAAFSFRFSDECAVKVVGGADKYEAVCGPCYVELEGDAELKGKRDHSQLKVSVNTSLCEMLRK